MLKMAKKKYLISIVFVTGTSVCMDRPAIHSPMPTLSRSSSHRQLESEVPENLRIPFIAAIYRLRVDKVKALLLENSLLIKYKLLTREWDGQRVDALSLLVMGACKGKIQKMNISENFKNILEIFSEYGFRVNKRFLAEILKGHDDIRMMLLNSFFAYLLCDTPGVGRYDKPLPLLPRGGSLHVPSSISGDLLELKGPDLIRSGSVPLPEGPDEVIEMTMENSPLAVCTLSGPIETEKQNS